jgi:hypothetical protein
VRVVCNINDHRAKFIDCKLLEVVQWHLRLGNINYRLLKHGKISLEISGKRRIGWEA